MKFELSAMQSGRLLRAAAHSAARFNTLRNVACYRPQAHTAIRRPLSANTAATPKRPSSAQAPGVVKSAEGTAEAGKTGEGANVVESSKVADGAKAAGETAPTAAAEQGAAKIPDVSSTSLGLEDPMTNDPLKWKKFAYKYAGALLLFLVSYKTLHWYVDRLEADGKRKREELEENKTIIEGIQGQQNSQDAPVVPGRPASPSTMAKQTVEASAGSTASPGLANALQQVPEGPGSQMRIFDPVKEEEPHLVSELDELYVYKIEMETKVKDLGMQTRTREIDTEKSEIETELKQLDKDIAELEAKNAKS